MKTPDRARLGAATLAAALHVVAIVALIRAFAPQLGATVLRPAIQAFDVAISPPLEPPPSPMPRRATAKAQGAAAPAGKKAKPRAVAAPRPPLVLAQTAAPPLAGKGAADSAGAADAGQGTGAGGQGNGTGAGAAGAGTGGGGASKPIKIAGDIVSARDYPKDTRELRLGSAVTIALSVTTEGRVSQCRIVRPSRDPEADRVTCRLATERFRFRPALGANGQPVTSVYGWQQRWFKP